MDIQLSQHHVLKRLFLSPLNGLGTSVKSHLTIDIREPLLSLTQISPLNLRPTCIHQAIQHIHLDIPRADQMVSNISKHVHIPLFFLGTTIHLAVEARNVSLSFILHIQLPSTESPQYILNLSNSFKLLNHSLDQVTVVYSLHH